MHLYQINLRINRLQLTLNWLNPSLNGFNWSATGGSNSFNELSYGAFPGSPEHPSQLHAEGGPRPPPPAPQSQFVGWKEARVLPTGTRGWGGTSKHGYLFQKVFPAPVSPGIHSQTLGTLALKGAPR